jgi:hypothetical protein
MSQSVEVVGFHNLEPGIVRETRRIYLTSEGKQRQRKSRASHTRKPVSEIDFCFPVRHCIRAAALYDGTASAPVDYSFSDSGTSP